MSKYAHSLDQISIPKPCNADWESMVGNDQIRFCEHCQAQVTNISSMTREEALRIVAESQGRLCVRYIRRPDGHVLTRDVPEKLLVIGRRVSRIAAGAFSATLSLATVAGQTSILNSDKQPTSLTQANQRSTGASLSGTVVDPAGAVVVGAVVTLTDLKTALAFVGTTSADGTYKFSLLDEGKYNLTVEAPTFTKTQITNIQIKTGEEVSQRVELTIPELIEQVQVTTRASVTEPATMGMVAIAEPKDPLIRAALKEDLDGIRQLVFASLNINLRDEGTGMTALDYAVGNGNLEIVRMLIMAGARADLKDESGRTALMRLSENATAELVRQLLSAGVEINERDKSGKTALMNAASRTPAEVVKELINNGAKIDLKDEDGRTALMFAASNDNNDLQTLKLLIDAGAVVNDKNNDGSTPLMIAAEEADAETVQLLISFGAEVNAKDPTGCTALMLVSATNDEDSVKVLLNAGADVTFRNTDGKTALAIARDANRKEIVRLLESRGAPE